MNTSQKNSILMGVGLVLFIIITLVISIFIYNKLNKDTKFISFGSELAIKENKPLITCWAWNDLSAGGFMGYGIFANDTDGYTWIKNNKNKAVGGKKFKITRVWDDQYQNTKALYAKNKDLKNPDSGSQFWDLISKNGSYNKYYNSKSMDGIKIQYDPVKQNDMNMSERYIQLLQNLIREDLHIGILIGGRPTIKGEKYHGISFDNMKMQIKYATKWIDSNKYGDNIYISLDIEPADKVLNNIHLEKTYEWYDTIFTSLSTYLNTFKDYDVYYGMAINKNPYQNKKAHDAWISLIKSQWKINGKERGFRIIELMYWWTKVDTDEVETSHLVSQLQTKSGGVTSNPVLDAIKNNCYIQFGMECTGEIDYLMYAPIPSDKPINCKDNCGTKDSPNPSKCFRAQDGILFVDENIGYRCYNKDNTLNFNTCNSNSNNCAFITKMKEDNKSEYWNTLKFTGDINKYVPLYGYPFLPNPKKQAPDKGSSYTGFACNALGNIRELKKDKDLEPIGTGGDPTCSVAGLSWKSCSFINKETWLLGGGLNNTQSMEEYLHSNEALKWIINIVEVVIEDSPHKIKAKNIIFKIPFSIEDFSGYSGWLHNFKYGTSTENPKKDLVGFPDTTITQDDLDGSLCVSRVQSNGKYLKYDESISNHQVNVPCLGQTILTSNEDGTKFTTDWVAGTLEYDDNNTKWTCPADKYLENDIT